MRRSVIAKIAIRADAELGLKARYDAAAADLPGAHFTGH
jgi:hypothetical protein